MNKIKQVETIYPQHQLMFVFDTALPVQLIDAIMCECFPELEPFTPEYSEKRTALYSSVYCYDKENRRQGILPLSAECLDILQQYQRRAGVTVIFTPTFSAFYSESLKAFKREFQELKELPSFKSVSFDDYKQSRFNGTSLKTIEKWFKPQTTK